MNLTRIIKLFLNMMESVSRKRKRNALDIHQKKDIVDYHDNHPKKSHQQLAEHFSTLWSIDMKRRTVGDILSQRDKWAAHNNVQPAAKRIKCAKHVDLEEALWIWFCNKRALNVVLTDDILRVKAMDFGKELGVTDFAYSNGWLHRFKQRHDISSHVLCGESAGVDVNLIQDGRQRAKEAASKFHPRDVYNMDETGLFFRMTPDRSLTTPAYTKGTKKNKDRITVALCTNSDGTDKLRPLVIGKSEKPRCFKTFNHKLYVDYAFNKKAWMTGSVFNDWITKVDRKMKRDKRRILLMMDNAPSHIIPKLTNITIHFLPPTTTSHLQPLDAGIINSFKAFYRKQQLRHIIDAIDATGSYTIALSDAIRYTKRAWDQVTATTIANCWAHTGITAKVIPPSDDDPEDDIPLAQLIERAVISLNIDPAIAMTETDLLTVENNIDLFPDLSDETILVTVKSTPSENDETEDDKTEDDKTLEPMPTGSEINHALALLLRHAEGASGMTESDLGHLCAFKSSVMRCRQINAKQPSIKSFLS